MTNTETKYCGFCRQVITGPSDMHKGMHRCATCASGATSAPAVSKPAVLDPSRITTNPTFPGLDGAESLGVVRGIAVRSRSVLGNALAGLQMVTGGNITAYEKLCDDTRQHAFDRMRAHAAQLGATAVTGMRFDATEITDGVSEVLCYGTAVRALSV